MCLHSFDFKWSYRFFFFLLTKWPNATAFLIVISPIPHSEHSLGNESPEIPISFCEGLCWNNAKLESKWHHCFIYQLPGQNNDWITFFETLPCLPCSFSLSMDPCNVFRLASYWRSVPTSHLAPIFLKYRISVGREALMRCSVPRTKMKIFRGGIVEINFCRG